MSTRSVAIIDIGSNSIKLLVARRAPDGSITPLAIQTLDARISAGISAAEPRLSDEGIRRGIEAIRALLGEAAVHAPVHTVLVATSAVRDAGNGDTFRAEVLAATGHEVRILNGEEEASLIGRGLTTDAALHTRRDFYVFDLGGGSLECLAFRDRRIEQAKSLQLGCVRLTERFIADPTLPLPRSSIDAISAYARDVFLQSGFTFSLPADAIAVGTGGTVTTARAVLAAHEGKEFEATPALVALENLRELLRWVGAKSLEERKGIAGLPPARADVFPAALATLVAVAELGRFRGFVNSVHNLRYGVADEVL